MEQLVRYFAKMTKYLSNLISMSDKYPTTILHKERSFKYINFKLKKDKLSSVKPLTSTLIKILN